MDTIYVWARAMRGPGGNKGRHIQERSLGMPSQQGSPGKGSPGKGSPGKGSPGKGSPGRGFIPSRYAPPAQYIAPHDTLRPEDLLSQDLLPHDLTASDLIASPETGCHPGCTLPPVATLCHGCHTWLPHSATAATPGCHTLPRLPHLPQLSTVIDACCDTAFNRSQSPLCQGSLVPWVPCAKVCLARGALCRWGPCARGRQRMAATSGAAPSRVWKAEHLPVASTLSAHSIYLQHLPTKVGA